MSDKIKEALSKLDPENDNHWTADGQPRLDTLKILTGNPGLSREDVTTAAPGFTRAQAAPQAPAGAPPSKGTDPVPPAAPAAPQPPAAPLSAPPLAEEADDLESLRREAEEATLTFNEAHTELQQMKERVEQLRKDMDAANDKLTLATREKEGNPIMGYLASQRKELEVRAARQKAIQDSGVDLKALTAGMRAPIDEAFQRRNTRGTSRPAAKR